MPDDNITRRRIIRSIGATTALGMAASGTASASNAADAPSIEKEPIPEKKLTSLSNRIRSRDDYRQISARIDEALASETTTEIRGYVLSDSAGKSAFDIVHLGRGDSERTAGIVWATTDDGSKLFGHVAGTAAELTDSARILRSETEVSVPATENHRVRIERFIEPNADYAVVTVLPKGYADEESMTVQDLEYVGTVDLEEESVTTQSVSSFVDCVTGEVGGIITGGGACALVCRSCIQAPSYLNCGVCAGCSIAAGCYIGSCADEHLAPAFCNQAIYECVNPVPPIPGPTCAMAYGCLGGNCGII